MRPFATHRFHWWDSLVAALLVLAVLACGGAIVVLAAFAGRRAILPIIGLGMILLGSSGQNRRVGLALCAVGGSLFGYGCRS